MTYIVKVLTPRGQSGYLSNGKCVMFRNAQLYPHPSSAKRAASGYRAKHDRNGLPTEAKVLNRGHLCLLCEHDFGEVPDSNSAYGCRSADCYFEDQAI